MLETAKVSDEMYEKHQIEEDEFNSAVSYYKLYSDPEVHKRSMELAAKSGLMNNMGGMMGGM